MDRPILCLVVDRATAVLPVEDAVREAVRGGVDWVQIRERELADAELLEWSESLAAAADAGAKGSERPVAVVMNRRVDIALALSGSGSVHGVHLGFDAVSPGVARELLGPEARIGVSTHHPDDVAELSRASQASYAHLAPIFPPLSKAASRPPLGVAELERACRWALPVLAQGGLNAGNAHLAIEAGAAGIAVTGAILQTSDPRAAAQGLRTAIDEAAGAVR